MSARTELALVLIAGTVGSSSTLASSRLIEPSQAPWSVVDRPDLEKYGMVSNPHILELPDGTLVATVDLLGEWTHEGLEAYRSTDRGKTWTTVEKSIPLAGSTLFRLEGIAYLIGVESKGRFGGGDARVSRSKDSGASWSNPWSLTTDVFRERASFWPSDSPVVVQGDRLWRVFDWISFADGKSDVRAFVASIPTDSDLLESLHWSWSEPLRLTGQHASWPSSCTLVPGSGRAPAVRVAGNHGLCESAADLSVDGMHLSARPVAPEWTEPEDVAGPARIHDPVRNRTVVLTLRRRPQQRGKDGESSVETRSSTDLREWSLDSVLLHDARPRGISFVQADWCIAGDDLLVVLCAGGSGPESEAGGPERLGRGALLFLRVAGFRGRKASDPPIWEASGVAPPAARER